MISPISILSIFDPFGGQTGNSYTFTVTVTDSVGNAGTRTYTLTINL
jgi:hypothetical protein